MFHSRNIVENRSARADTSAIGAMTGIVIALPLGIAFWAAIIGAIWLCR